MSRKKKKTKSRKKNRKVNDNYRKSTYGSAVGIVRASSNIYQC